MDLKAAEKEMFFVNIVLVRDEELMESERTAQEEWNEATGLERVGPPAPKRMEVAPRDQAAPIKGRPHRSERENVGGESGRRLASKGGEFEVTRRPSRGARQQEIMDIGYLVIEDIERELASSGWTPGPDSGQPILEKENSSRN
jgi:hypothetical protein